ncbi:MAG: serine/threonine protein kinase [Ilumatobacteraceae bacterium]|nr:serine/threonine protein kinase [Ilumatobacteraceae bacterium]
MDEPTPTAPEAQDPCPHCGQPVGDAWLVCAWCGTQIAAPAELPIGATLADGRYQVIAIIGRGGFGITYEVGDTRLKRRVAVKELFPESAVRHGSMVLTPPQARASFRSARDRFLREARVLARFTHPGIVRVYEVFEAHGTAYLVMERLSGRTLVDVLRARNQPFEEAEVLDVAARVAAALRPVHAAGVLHRDVNPSNVMLTEHGRVVVIDFGLARDFDPGQTMGMTRMVTPGYAPLEQYRGEGRFGPTTDIYGLAATCYRLATGRVPVAAVERDTGAEIPAPHRINPAISKSVSDAILDGLELEPAHRPQDLDAFLARLGVRWLPDTPQSILLGSVGAEPADLAVRTDADGHQAETIAGLSGPAPARRPIADPGPAVAPAVPIDPVPVTAISARPTPSPVPGDDARSRLATEIVARPGAPRPLRPPPPLPPRSTTPFRRSEPAPTAVAPVDGGATHVPPPVVDADRTWVPDDVRGADATQAPALGWSGLEPDGPQHHDAVPAGSRAPRPGLVTVPLAVFAIAAGSAAPLVVIGLLVLVVLPLLATVGDHVARQQRAQRGFADGRVERLPSGVVVPSRFVRNLVTSVLRTSPIVGVTALFVAAWYALAQTSLPVGVLEASLRIVGGGAVAVLLLSAREGSPRFRSGMGIDRLVTRFAPDGRVTERLVVMWLVLAIGVAAALWLTPDAFPLP